MSRSQVGRVSVATADYVKSEPRSGLLATIDIDHRDGCTELNAACPACVARTADPGEG